MRKRPFDNTAIEEACKLARHGIGHWVIAHHLGLVAGDVTAKVTFGGGFPYGREGSSEIALAENIKSVEETISYLERRIQVCWAGVVAEAFDPLKRKVDVEEAVRLSEGASGKADARIARECNQLLRNMKWKWLDGGILTQLRSLSDRLSKKTIEIVEAQDEIILGLAGNLADRIQVAGFNNAATFTVTEMKALPDVLHWLQKLHGA